MTDYGAYLLREKTGTTDVAETLRRAVEILAHWDTPHYVVGGIDRPGRLRDRTNGVFVDVLPAGRVLQRGCHVPFPTPEEVSEEPRFVTLEQLISLKLDSWAGAPTRRSRDKTDVVELIAARKLPRTLRLHRAVQGHYEEIWDALQSEGPGPQA